MASYRGLMAILKLLEIGFPKLPRSRFWGFHDPLKKSIGVYMRGA